MFLINWVLGLYEARLDRQFAELKARQDVALEKLRKEYERVDQDKKKRLAYIAHAAKIVEAVLKGQEVSIYHKDPVEIAETRALLDELHRLGCKLRGVDPPELH